MSKTGRKSSFPEDQLKAIEVLCKLGATDKDIAAAYGVTEQTVNNWKKDHPPFFESLKGWKAVADEEMEKSLYSRGKGCTVKQTRYAVKDEDGGELVKVEIIEKELPPDTAAAFIWLKNRKPKDWKDKQGEEGVSDKLVESISELIGKLPS